MKVRRYLMLSIAIALLVATALFWISGQRSGQTKVGTYAHETTLSNAQSFEQDGIMHVSDSMRMFSIVSQSSATRISDSDLSYMIQLMNSKPLVDTPSNRELHFQSVASKVCAIQQLWEPKQSNIVVEAIAPHLYGTNYEKLSALYVLARLARRTVQKGTNWRPSDQVKKVVNALRSDRDAQVQNVARRVYASIWP